MAEGQVEEVVAAEVDDVEGDVSPEEFMARRQAALAKRKPGTGGCADPGCCCGRAAAAPAAADWRCQADGVIDRWPLQLKQ